MNSKQQEVEYQASGSTVTTHYSGGGGIPLTNVFARMAVAIHLHDFNLLISNLITPKFAAHLHTQLRASKCSGRSPSLRSIRTHTP